jgi:hypothetical protein
MLDFCRHYDQTFPQHEITNEHIRLVLKSMRPSVSPEEGARLNQMWDICLLFDLFDRPLTSLRLVDIVDSSLTVVETSLFHLRTRQ